MRVRWMATMVVLGLFGCTRGYYQRQADNEVADKKLAALVEKPKDERAT